MSSENLVAVIGDVHGCLFTLKTLYQEILKFTGEVYSVGDIIDRGNHVSDTLRFFKDNNIRPVRGNHEDMLLKAVGDHEGLLSKIRFSSSLSNCYSNGFAATMLSYIESDEPSEFPEFVKIFSASGHLDYIRSFPVKTELDNLVITHAGVTEDGDEYGMLWNRRLPANIGKLQVHGHTPVSDAVLSVNNSINIDTGCVYGRNLTSAIINTKTGEVAEILTEKIKEEDYS